MVAEEGNGVVNAWLGVMESATRALVLIASSCYIVLVPIGH